MVKEEAPRLRLAEHIDMSKADPQCSNCNGTGVSGEKEIDSRIEGEVPSKVPVICRCVSRVGGVKEDILDRILKEVEKEYDNGTFGYKLAADVIGLPEPMRQLTTNKLIRQWAETDDEKFKQVLGIALKEIQKSKENTDGNSRT